MKTMRLICACVVAASLSFIVAVGAQTTTVTLSGKVRSESSPLAGASVSAENVVTGGTFGPTMTGDDGGYQLALPPGTYDFHVTPPAASGLGPAVALARAVAADSIIDFVLLEAGSARFDGRLLGGLGAGLANQYFVLSAPTLPTIQTLTAADGAFAFGVQVGDYSTTLWGSWPGPDSPAGMPQYYYVGSSNQMAITGTISGDLQLPFKRVNVHVQDPGAAPVANVGLSTTSINTCDVPFGAWRMCGYSAYWSGNGLVTDANGNATLWLWPTVANPDVNQAYAISAKPPDGSDYAATAAGNIVVTGETSVTITLQQANKFSGRLLGGLGTGLASQYFVLSAPALPTTQTLTAADGAFAFGLQAGDYSTTLWGSWPGPDSPAGMPQYYYVGSSNQMAIAGTVSGDLQLPFKQVNVHVQGPAGAPVANVGLSTTSINTCDVPFGAWRMCGYSAYWSGNGLVTDANGNATLWLWPTVANPDVNQAYAITAKPPDGSDYAATAAGNIAVTGETSVTITLQQANTFSGRLLGGLGTGLASQYFVLSAPALPTVQTLTAADGAFAFGLQAGDYSTTLWGSWPGPDSAAGMPQYYYIGSSNQMAVAGTVTADIRLPFKRVNVHVQDRAGAPVANVGMSTTSVNTCDVPVGAWRMCGYSAYWSGSGLVTDANGDATLWLWPTVANPSTEGAYSITAKPPDGSPFVTFGVGNVEVISDKSIVIVLPWAHDPPITTASLTPSPGAGGKYSGAVTVNLSAIAFGGANVAQTNYEVDGGATQSYTGAFQVTTDGPHTLKYWSVDSAGVSELPRTTTFEIALGKPASITSNFNGTPISAGRFIWFNSVLSMTGGNGAAVTITVTDQTVTGSAFSIPIPDAEITFDPAATQATTQFVGGRWVTRVPASGLAGKTFLAGLAYPVAADLPGGINPVTWSGRINASQPGVTVQWQWAAAVYSNLATDHALLGVKPVDDNKASAYQNSDHAGTPEAFKAFVTGGARGGGGSNYTGSYSGTGKIEF